MKDREIYGSHWESALYYAEQIDEEGKKVPRLIDANEIKLPRGFFEKVNNVPKFYEWLDKQPTVEAEPVRYGIWLERNSGLQKWIRCSVCNYRQHYTNKTNYCPNCGAKMDKNEWQEPEINPCRDCGDYDGQGGCKSNGGCGERE